MSPGLAEKVRVQNDDYLVQVVSVRITLPFVSAQAIDLCDSNPLLTSGIITTAL